MSVMGYSMHILSYSQKLPITLDKAWDFFSNPENLKTLTPPHMGFEIMNTLHKQKMYAGQIIIYTIRPFCNIPLEWITEITHVKHHEYFIDEQRFGPYSFWHHTHCFTEIENGIEMTDTIYYKLPFGIFGRLLNSLKVEQDIKKIFSYRKTTLESLFGS